MIPNQFKKISLLLMIGAFGCGHNQNADHFQCKNPIQLSHPELTEIQSIHEITGAQSGNYRAILTRSYGTHAPSKNSFDTETLIAYDSSGRIDSSGIHDQNRCNGVVGDQGAYISSESPVFPLIIARTTGAYSGVGSATVRIEKLGDGNFATQNHLLLHPTQGVMTELRKDEPHEKRRTYLHPQGHLEHIIYKKYPNGFESYFSVLYEQN